MIIFKRKLMHDKLEKILSEIEEVIRADDSGTCHLIIAKDAVENAIKAVERSVTHIMGNNDRFAWSNYKHEHCERLEDDRGGE
jgi:hypothetical protein